MDDKLKGLYVCQDRTNLYRKADETEEVLGQCNTTFNDDWKPGTGQIKSVEWYYCKHTKTCIDSYTRLGLISNIK